MYDSTRIEPRDRRRRVRRDEEERTEAQAARRVRNFDIDAVVTWRPRARLPFWVTRHRKSNCPRTEAPGQCWNIVVYFPVRCELRAHWLVGSRFRNITVPVTRRSDILYARRSLHTSRVYPPPPRIRLLASPSSSPFLYVGPKRDPRSLPASSRPTEIPTRNPSIWLFYAW